MCPLRKRNQFCEQLASLSHRYIYLWIFFQICHFYIVKWINWGGGKSLVYQDLSRRSPMLLDGTFHFLYFFFARFLRVTLHSLFFSGWFNQFSVQSILFSCVNMEILLFFYILLTDKLPSVLLCSWEDIFSIVWKQANNYSDRMNSKIVLMHLFLLSPLSFPEDILAVLALIPPHSPVSQTCWRHSILSVTIIKWPLQHAASAQKPVF